MLSLLLVAVLATLLLRTTVAGASSSLACGTWSVVPGPSTLSQDILHGVAASSGRNVWAAGSSYSGGSVQTLIEHWDSKHWSIVPSGGGNALYGVAVLSKNNAWTVGNVNSSPPQTLIKHWDGTTWSIIPSPSPGSVNNYLYSVAALSANNIWAVGSYTSAALPRWAAL